MGLFDWVNQAGNWLRDNIAKPVSTGINWVNQNVVQPAANALQNVPVVGDVAKAVGQVGNAAQNIGEMAAGKRKADLGEALGNVNTIKSSGQQVYDTVKKRK